MAASASRASLPHRPARTLLVFQVGAFDCALPVQAVRELLPMAALARAPGQPSVLEGFLNLRGAAVPVVRLHRLFDLPLSTPGLYTPLIVLRGDPHPVALLVDKVIEVTAVHKDALLPVDDSQTFNGCAEERAEIGGRTVHVLSPGRILLEQERQSIAGFQAVAQQYLDELEAGSK